jgi:hypothetical protein
VPLGWPLGPPRLLLCPRRLGPQPLRQPCLRHRHPCFLGRPRQRLLCPQHLNRPRPPGSPQPRRRRPRAPAARGGSEPRRTACTQGTAKSPHSAAHHAPPQVEGVLRRQAQAAARCDRSRRPLAQKERSDAHLARRERVEIVYPWYIPMSCSKGPRKKESGLQKRRARATQPLDSHGWLLIRAPAAEVAAKRRR